MNDTSTREKLADSSVARTHTVTCPHKKMPADVIASKWQMTNGQWTSWTIVDCPLLLAGLMNCDMSCLSQLEEIRATNVLP
jgi:hypothetical protein